MLDRLAMSVWRLDAALLLTNWHNYSMHTHTHNTIEEKMEAFYEMLYSSLMSLTLSILKEFHFIW